MTVPVNPAVLSWARDVRGLTLEAAAELLEWSVGQVKEVEASDEVSLAELERMATKYRLPLATLLMPEPLPADRYPRRALNDFRLHAHMEQEPLSIKTQMRVESAFELIELLSEVNEADDELAPRPLLPSFGLDDDPMRAAARERARIGADLDMQLGWETHKEAFLHWRETIEAEEIIVHKLTLPEKSVRGFALFKNGYALVAVDSADDYQARCFTLWHEYAHLLLRMGGISDQNRQIPVERWCNQFAACFLMPGARFRQEYERLFPNTRDADDYQVGRMAARFKTSKSSVAIRFEELGLAPAGFYDRLKKEWQNRPTKKGGGGGNDPIDIELGRFGTTHVSTISAALERGIIDRLEAQYALDVPPDHLAALAAAARERHQAYGPPR